MKTVYRMKWISIFLCLPASPPYPRVTPVCSKLVREGHKCLAILPSFHITPFECLSSYVQATSLLLKTQLGIHHLGCSSVDSSCRLRFWILQVPIGTAGTRRESRLAGGLRNVCYCLPPWQSGKGCEAQCTEP